MLTKADISVGRYDLRGESGIFYLIPDINLYSPTASQRQWYRVQTIVDYIRSLWHLFAL